MFCASEVCQNKDLDSDCFLTANHTEVNVQGHTLGGAQGSGEPHCTDLPCVSKWHFFVVIRMICHLCVFSKKGGRRQVGGKVFWFVTCLRDRKEHTDFPAFVETCRGQQGMTLQWSAD